MPDPEGTIINEDGSFAEGWYSKYDESYHPTLSRFKNFDEYVESDMSARKKLGKDPERLVEIPADDADEKTVAAFHKRLGVPDKYEYAKDPDLKYEADEEKVKAMAAIAKKHHLTKKQFDGIANEVFGLLGKDATDRQLVAEQQNQQDYENANATLKEMLGSSYEIRAARANKVFGKYSDIEIKDANGNVTGTVGEKILEAFPKLNNSPWLTMVFDAIANDMSEDRIKGITSISTQTPEAITTKLTNLRNDPAYYDRSNPKHKQVIEERQRLMKQLSA